MQLLQITDVSNTFARCSACGYLMRPIVLARHLADGTCSLYCMRCYHALAVSRGPRPDEQGGA